MVTRHYFTREERTSPITLQLIRKTTSLPTLGIALIPRLADVIAATSSASIRTELPAARFGSQWAAFAWQVVSASRVIGAAFH
jgi:hypothetical protein